jgi:GNAT superfamily N-acetyltransferase
VQIRDLHLSEIEAARRLLAANGWAHRVADAEAFRTLVLNSQRTAAAFVDGELVGFARALCDGVVNGYISMVVVAAAYRQKGIGRALVGHLMGSDPRITWVLRAGRASAAPFFTKLGFVPSTVAMERNRAPQST